LITIKDIAKMAGVSDTTVSNVIHNRRNVSAKTVEKINRIIQETHYIPNLNARSLTAKSSPLIACVFSSRNMTVNSLYLSRLMTAIEEVLFSNGLYMIVKNIDGVDNISNLFEMWKIQGLIAIGSFSDSMIENIENAKIPAVFIDALIEKECEYIYSVNIDDFNAAYNATEHLISLGHKKIACVSHGISGSKINKSRYKGYRHALEVHGIQFDSYRFYEISSNYNTNDTNTVIEVGKEIAKSDITAVFAVSDMLAWDVILGIQSTTKSVPDDISVIGFDDMFICSRIVPALSSVHNSSKTKGTVSAQLLVDILNDKKVEHRTIIPTSVVLRNSTSSCKY